MADGRQSTQADDPRVGPLPALSENALGVLRKRYFLKDRVEHPVEDVDDFFARVVHGVIRVEKEQGWVDDAGYVRLAADMYELLRGLRFIPNSPCLMNAGKPDGYAQLAACFVLPIEDDLRSIKTTDMNAAIIHQTGGGTGFNFSKIRPRGDFVRSSGGVASGPISFMSMIDFSCGEIKQGGTRRGANMGILNVDHPDIVDFIGCKSADGKISNFNISVGVTDAFMQAVDADQMYDLINPRTKKVDVDPATEEPKRLRAREVWDRVVDGAWLNGEPGMIFLDRLRRSNPTPLIAEQDTTNPCGEQPLLPYEACVLGSLNLAWHLSADRSAVDWTKLRRDVHLAIRFLDDMVEASHFPLQEINDIVKHGNRRVGLGLMGWADLLFALSVAYDSPEAEALADQVMRFINEEARRASEELAEQRRAFPNWKGSQWQMLGHAPRRNATVTTIAPTGTISMIADCSSGIEPLFALIFWKNVMRDSDDNQATTLRYLNPLFETYARDHGFFSDELIDAIEANHGSLRIGAHTPSQARAVLADVPADARRIFVTAHDVSPEGHIRVQAAFQRHTENAVSKTINFSNESTREDVEAGYRLAYQLGCKGVTVYRDGSRDMQVLTTSDVGDRTRQTEPEATVPANGQPVEAAATSGNGRASERSNGHTSEPPATDPSQAVPAAEQVNGSTPADPQREALPVLAASERDRPDMMRGSTARIRTGCGPLFVTINDDEHNEPFELFATLGKAGGCAAAQTEAIGRLVSLALRSGVPAQTVHRHLRGITCHRPAGFGPNRVLSCGDAIAQVVAQRMDAKADGFVPLVDLQGEGTYEPPTASLEGAPEAVSAPSPRAVVEAAVSAAQPGDAPQLGDASVNVATFAGACPTCGGSQLYHAEGCVKCMSCGYSDCG